MFDFADMIKNACTWQDIYRALIMNMQNSGKSFEEFIKLYFLCEPTVFYDYKNVWLFREVPLKIHQRLGIGHKDYGIEKMSLIKYCRLYIKVVKDNKMLL
jgi:hypothetical protein